MVERGWDEEYKKKRRQQFKGEQNKRFFAVAIRIEREREMDQVEELGERETRAWFALWFFYFADNKMTAGEAKQSAKKWGGGEKIK